MKNVLFTGLNGFIGKNFLSCIKSNDIKIQKLPEIKCKDKKKQNYSYQFTAQDLINAGIKDIDVIVHLGAFSPKTKTQMNDLANITNITNTSYLFTHLSCIPKRVIYISTISVYDEKSNINKIYENSITAPNTIYGLSKLFCERLVEKYCNENNIEYQILRLGVVYGNNIFYKGLIPTFITQILNSNSITIFSGGKLKLQFINVEDVCHIIYKSIVQEKVLYKIVNVVGEEIISIKEIADTLIEISKKDIKIIDKKTEGNTYEILYDTSLLKKVFNHNQISMSDGLKKAYKEFGDSYAGL